MANLVRGIFRRHWNLCTAMISRYTVFVPRLNVLYTATTTFPPAWVTLWLDLSPLSISVTYVLYMIQRNRWQLRHPAMIMSPILCRYGTNKKVSQQLKFQTSISVFHYITVLNYQLFTHLSMMTQLHTHIGTILVIDVGQTRRGIRALWTLKCWKEL